MNLAARRPEIVRLVQPAVERRHPPELPFELASGARSFEYVDVKYPLSYGPTLEIIGSYAISLVREREIAFNVIGGPTLGANGIVSAMTILRRGCRWFYVAKPGEPDTKYDAAGHTIVGTRLRPGDNALVVEDAVSSGESLLRAVDTIGEYCQERDIKDVNVVAALTVVDRGTQAAELFAARGIPYIALTNYADLGIEPVN